MAMDDEKKFSREFFVVYEYELSQFAHITNLHGMARWKDARNIFSKLFWSVIVIAVMMFSIVQVTSLITMYLSHPTMSEVRFAVPDDGLEFPTITVCNYNPVKASVAIKYDMINMTNSDVLEYVLTTYMQPSDLYAYYDLNHMTYLHSRYQEYTQQYKDETGNDFDLPTFFWDASYQCKDMFLSCSFGGIQFDCCQYAEAIMTDMGKCYRLKSFGHNNNRQLLSGPDYGFQVYLDAQVTEYPNTNVNAFEEIGIKFSIQQSNAAKYMTTGAYAVSPSNRFYAGIVPTHYILLPENSWGKCQDTWPSEYDSTEPYSANNCKFQCEATGFLEKCGCVPLRFSPDAGQPVCDSLRLYQCIQQSSILTDETYWKTKCSDCGIECDRWSYDTQSSYAAIPSFGAAQTLANRFNITEPYLRENVLALTVYFAEIAYSEYEQMQATSLTETFSNIGGTLGLFIGFSVITFFELLLFIIKVIWGCASIKRRKTLTVKRNSSTESKIALDDSAELGECSKSSKEGKPPVFTISNDTEEKEKW